MIVKPHKCEKCNYTTSRKSILQSHIQKVHENLQPFVCQNCGKHFGYKQYFNIHIKICPNLTEKRQLNSKIIVQFNKYQNVNFK